MQFLLFIPWRKQNNIELRVVNSEFSKKKKKLRKVRKVRYKLEIARLFFPQQSPNCEDKMPELVIYSNSMAEMGFCSY